MPIKTVINKVLLSAACFLIPNLALAQKTDKVTELKNAFQMHAWPKYVVVHRNQSIPVKITLRNMTDGDAYIRLWFWPVPFGPHTDLHSLVLRCRNQSTGKEVQYIWPPAGRTISDAQGKELPDKIPSGRSVKIPIDLRQFCVLPHGKYVLELQYDTRFVPSWVKPDRRAWHGITNKVTVRIQVLD